MNETVIETQARYLIEDRVRPTHGKLATSVRRRHRRIRKLSWL
jgi:hypothetical protein